MKQSDLKGKLILDAGCGFGRHAYVAKSLGARVVAVDVSEAVDSAHSMQLGKVGGGG